MSKTGLYYLYGDYPSQILGDPEHKVYRRFGSSKILPLNLPEREISGVKD